MSRMPTHELRSGSFYEIEKARIRGEIEILENRIKDENKLYKQYGSEAYKVERDRLMKR